MKIFIFPLIFLSFHSISGNKYAKEANVPSDDAGGNGEERFRVQKLNFIWSKAIRKLDIHDQKELLLHLKKLDKQLLAAKYERDGGRDSGGVLLKDLEKSLENLLKRYGMVEVYESLTYGAGEKSIDGSTKDSRNEVRIGDLSKTFKDQKLRRLWLDAVAGGQFDDTELAALEAELQHYQIRLEEFDKMSANGKKAAKEDKQNSVLTEHYDDDAKSKANAELKQKFKDIQRDYDSLKKKVAGKAQSKENGNGPSISHPRVIPLLEKARSMYSGAELESIEEELRHFEKRLQKLEYLTTEAERSKPELDSAKKAKREKSVKIHDRELVNQLSQYSRKMDKYEQYLSSKLEL